MTFLLHWLHWFFLQEQRIHYFGGLCFPCWFLSVFGAWYTIKCKFRYWWFWCKIYCLLHFTSILRRLMRTFPRASPLLTDEIVLCDHNNNIRLTDRYNSNRRCQRKQQCRNCCKNYRISSEERTITASRRNRLNRFLTRWSCARWVLWTQTLCWTAGLSASGGIS